MKISVYICLCGALAAAGCRGECDSYQAGQSSPKEDPVASFDQLALRRAVDKLSRESSPFVAEEFKKSNYLVTTYKLNKTYDFTFTFKNVPDASVTVEVTTQAVRIIGGGWVPEQKGVAH